MGGGSGREVQAFLFDAKKQRERNGRFNVAFLDRKALAEIHPLSHFVDASQASQFSQFSSLSTRQICSVLPLPMQP